MASAPWINSPFQVVRIGSGSTTGGPLSPDDIDRLNTRELSQLRSLRGDGQQLLRVVLHNCVNVVVTDKYVIMATITSKLIIMERNSGLILAMPHTDLTEDQQHQARDNLLKAITHMRPQYQPAADAVVQQYQPAAVVPRAMVRTPYSEYVFGVATVLVVVLAAVIGVYTYGSASAHGNSLVPVVPDPKQVAISAMQESTTALANLLGGVANIVGVLQDHASSVDKSIHTLHERTSSTEEKVTTVATDVKELTTDVKVLTAQITKFVEEKAAEQKAVAAIPKESHRPAIKNKAQTDSTDKKPPPSTNKKPPPSGGGGSTTVWRAMEDLSVLGWVGALCVFMYVNAFVVKCYEIYMHG